MNNTLTSGIGKCILFLYSELAGYTVACINHLSKTGVQVDIVRWPVKDEAPFEFEFAKGITVHEKSEFNAVNLYRYIVDSKPDAIVVSGWMDKDYFAAVKKIRGSVPVVLTLDNHWTGSVKQRVLQLGRSQLRKIYTHVWVPGSPQKRYAKKLGFPESNILEGFYSCDTPWFLKLGEDAERKKAEVLPHRFIYVGRYVKHKGIFDMWEAFQQLKQETTCDWELWCLGTGDEYENRIESKDIKHFGFVQPDQIGSYLEQTSVYILPSHFEPWGVSVHEMAAARFPLLLSEQVGASSALLSSGYNGFCFKEKSVSDLKSAMLKIVNSTDDQLRKMGVNSKELATHITPDKWTESLLNVVND